MVTVGVRDLERERLGGRRASIWRCRAAERIGEVTANLGLESEPGAWGMPHDTWGMKNQNEGVSKEQVGELVTFACKSAELEATTSLHFMESPEAVIDSMCAC